MKTPRHRAAIEVRTGAQHRARAARYLPLHPGILIALPVSLLTLAIWSEAGNAATECGYPANGIHNPAGAYLWQNCTSGKWNLRITGDGSNTVHSGSVTASAAFAKVTPVKLESDDSVDAATAPAVISYRLDPANGADGFDYQVADGATVCFDPGTTPVHVGANAQSVSGPFDPATLDACNTEKPTVDISPKTLDVNEGDGMARFAAVLSAPYYKDVAVSFESRQGNADNAATPGDDFKAFSGSLTIPAGQTGASIEIPVTNDTQVEQKERFQVALTGADNAVVGTMIGHADILDDDSDTDSTTGDSNEPLPTTAPTVDIAPKTVTVSEGDGSAVFSARLSTAYYQDVQVMFETRQGNATNAATPGDDFEAFGASLTIPAGETSGSIVAPLVDDSLVEDKERFQVALTGALNAELGVKIGHADILDDDSGSISPAPDTDSGLALVQPGPHAYLNDVDRGVRPTEMAAGSGLVDGLGWPRIGLADTPINQSVEQLAKYHMIAAQNLSKVGKAQAINPDLVYLRQVNPIEFQLSVKQAMPFNGTGPSTYGTNVYAGHWVYGPGTRLSQNISASATTIKVDDANKMTAGSYVVIYDAPAGSFKNAEHLYVSAVDQSTNTLTVSKRGYKSKALSHVRGSIIAKHTTGQGQKSNKENWVYNQSSACPRDARGNTFGEAMVEWLVNNYNRLVDGRLVDVRIDGFHFDTDRYFILAGKKSDVDNDLVEDDGVDASGYNMWGEGLERFYADLRAAMPGMFIVGGGTGSRGMSSLNGVQWEGFPVEGGFFSVNPDYTEADSHLANYGFHVRHHLAGAAITQALNKSPTKLYPNLKPNHLGDDGAEPTSNAPFRFSFGLALMDDGFYGQPSSGDHIDVWWDEYSVDVVPGSPTFGQAMPMSTTDETLLREHRSWMGMPLGERVRVYDENAFAAANSLLGNGSFDSNLNGWVGKNLTISTDGSAAGHLEGTRGLLASRHHSYAVKPHHAQVLGPSVYLEQGREYTLAFAVKSSAVRQINVAVGGATNQMFVVGTDWARRVVSFKANKTGNQRLKFQLGRDDTEVWLDAVYLFEGNASVFQRDFENARIVVNATPKARTIDLGGTFQRILGTGQDPINDGSTLQQVTVGPYDAAILIRP